VDGFAARASRRPPVIKVLHVFKTFFPDTYGGIEQVVRTLAENAAAQGIDCRVLVLSPQGSSTTVEPSGYTLIRCQTTVNVASTGFSWAFFHQFRQHADWADIVHVHYPWPFIDLTVLLRGCKTPMVMTYHSDIVNQTRLERFYAPLRDWFLRKQKRIVATSPNYAASSPILQTYTQKLSVIPIGIAAAEPAPAAHEIARWRHLLGEKYFIFIGVPRYYKGLSYLLQAMKGRNYPLAIVGDGGDRADLERLACALDLTGIRFLGALSEADKNAVLMGARAMVLPSHKRSEAYGIVLAEASAMGVPMITCEIGTGTSFVNLHEQTGLVVAPQDPEALGVALDRMWTDDAAVAQWCKSARERYAAHFDALIMAQRYDEVYRDLFSFRTEEASVD